MRADDLVGGGVDVEVLRPSLSDELRMTSVRARAMVEECIVVFLAAKLILFRGTARDERAARRHR